MDKIKIGKIGESHAEQFLSSQSYEIIAKNFYCRYGEIDLIAVDFLNSRELVFVEVKTRTSGEFGEPEESVHYKKRQHILKTALHFMNISMKKAPRSWRVDVIAVKLDSQNRLKEIRHLKNIFNGN